MMNENRHHRGDNSTAALLIFCGGIVELMSVVAYVGLKYN
jgi:hypothetical protein